MGFMDEGQLRETITIKEMTSRSSAGDPVYGAASTMKARIERGRQRQLKGTDGELLNDTTVLYTIGPVDLDTLLWFPEDDTNSTEAAHRPAVCQPQYDLDGVLSHYETTF